MELPLKTKRVRELLKSKQITDNVEFVQVLFLLRKEFTASDHDTMIRMSSEELARRAIK